MASVVTLAVLLVVGGLGWIVRDRAAREEQFGQGLAKQRLRIEESAARALDVSDEYLQQDNWQQSLVEARRENRSVAVLYIDLDQFKRINDTLGHQTGDALLRMVTDRLHTLAGARGDDDVYGVFARVGGDEFILVLTGNATIGSAQRAAERVQAALVAPFLHGGYEFVVTPSIGIALFPEHGNDSQSLLKNADGAMYEAKASGRNQYRVYTSAVHARALKRLSLEMELRQAFENSQLQVYYQPKYETQSLRLIGAEALLRWFHPERGQIPTIDFVAVAEEIGLMSPYPTVVKVTKL